MRTIVFMLCALCLLSSGCQPDRSLYETLKEPRIVTIPDQRMLTLTVQGDPNEIASKAFASLYKSYYSLKGVSLKLDGPSPRVRWTGADPKKPKSEWTGVYALPVPDSVTALPSAGKNSLGELRLETWAYGPTAEVLHVGAYHDEEPTVARLHAFIRAQGYHVAGPHEEEYIKGQGMIFRGNPAKYQTLIRYSVRRTR